MYKTTEISQNAHGGISMRAQSHFKLEMKRYQFENNSEKEMASYVGNTTAGTRSVNLLDVTEIQIAEENMTIRVV